MLLFFVSYTRKKQRKEKQDWEQKNLKLTQWQADTGIWSMSTGKKKVSGIRKHPIRIDRQRWLRSRKLPKPEILKHWS